MIWEKVKAWRFAVWGTVASAALTGFPGMAGAQQTGAGGSGAGSAATGTGPFVRMVRHNDGSRSITARDENTKEMVITTYDPDGNLRLRRNYQLDRYGKPTTYFIYDGGGRPLMRGEYIYDAQDRVIEEKMFELPGQTPIRTMAQTYDGSGKRLPPQYMHQAGLPPEVMRWLDPDKAVAGTAQTEGKKAGTAAGARPGLFGKKKEGGATAGATEPERKGPLQGLFKKPNQ